MLEAVEFMLEKEFPLPFVLVLVGYSIILLIDKVIIDSHDTNHHSHKEPKDIQMCQREHV
jgi:hypothetical protein